MGPFGYTTHNCSILPVFMGVQCIKDSIDTGCRNSHDHFAFIRHFERVNTKHTGSTSDIFANGDLLFLYPDTDPAFPCHLVDRAGKTASRGVLHCMDCSCVQHFLDHSPERRHV